LLIVGRHHQGPLTIRVYEEDDAPYEHVVDVPPRFHRSELPYVAKVRRLAGWGGRKKVTENDVDKEVDDDATNPANTDSKASAARSRRDLLEERTANWTEAEKQKQLEQGFEYIRIDPDCEWLAVIRFEPLSINKVDMPGPLFFASQLLRERDAIGQKEVRDVSDLTSPPSAHIASFSNRRLTTCCVTNRRESLLCSLTASETGVVSIVFAWQPRKLYCG
jgi:transcription initiation factor TFIID subunit 2